MDGTGGSRRGRSPPIMPVQPPARRRHRRLGGTGAAERRSRYAWRRALRRAGNRAIGSIGGTGSGDVAILCRRGHISQLPPSVSSDDSCHCRHRCACLHAVPHAPPPEPPSSALPATPARTPVMERMNASAELLKELRIDRKSPPPASGDNGGGRRWLWIAIIVVVLLVAPWPTCSVAHRYRRGGNRSYRGHPAGQRQQFGARRQWLRGCPSHGHGVGQDHRQGARGDDRGRHAGRSRPGDGHARPDRCRRAAQPVCLAAAGCAQPGGRPGGTAEAGRRRSQPPAGAGWPAAGLALAVRPGRGPARQSACAAGYRAAQRQGCQRPAGHRRSGRGQQHRARAVLRRGHRQAAQPGEIVSPLSAGGGFTRTGIGTIVDMDSLEIEVEVGEAFIYACSRRCR